MLDYQIKESECNSSLMTFKAYHGFLPEASIQFSQLPIPFCQGTVGAGCSLRYREPGASHDVRGIYAVEHVRLRGKLFKIG